MRKINQEIVPLVPGSRRRTHFTGQGGSEGPPASPSRALGCVGPSQGWSILWVGGGGENPVRAELVAVARGRPCAGDFTL